MSRHHEIARHMDALRDIEEIMDSMKGLSLMESHRLGRFLASQQRVVESIRAAARDFLGAYPHFLRPPAIACSLHIIIGAERGFCGDFNQSLMAALNTHWQRHPPPDPKLVAVGAKLINSVDTHPLLAETLEGPAVAQEVEAVLPRLTQTLWELDQRYGPASVTIYHHAHEHAEIQIVSLLPPFLELKQRSAASFPPRLNLAVDDFYGHLVDHYLFAALHEIFYTSLMAEHQRRAQHLEAAIRRLRDKLGSMGKKRNRLRQEEITEEIEVIMLSTGTTDRYPL